MAAGIKSAIADVVEQLVAADISADVDPAGVNLPGVLVKLGTIRPEFLDGSGSVEVVLYLTASNIEPLDAIDDLDGLLAQVVDVVDPDGDLVPVSVAFDNGSSLPAIQLTTIRNYSKD